MCKFKKGSLIIVITLNQAKHLDSISQQKSFLNKKEMENNLNKQETKYRKEKDTHIILYPQYLNNI